MKFLQLRKGMLVKHRDAIPFPPPPSERVGVVVCTTGYSETCPDSVKVLWNGGEIESHWTDELEVIREAG